MIKILYPLNSLFFYRLLFMAQLIVCESIFLIRLPKKNKFVIKAPLLILSCFVFAFIFPIPTGNTFYSMMMFFVFFIYTYVMSLFLFNANWQMILFCLICGYTTEHIAYEIYSALSNFFVVDFVPIGGLYDYDSLALFKDGVDVTLYIASFVNVLWPFYLIFTSRIEKGLWFDNKAGLKVLLMGFFFIILDIVINSVVSFYSTIHYDRIYLGSIAIVNALACILGILFIFEMYYSSSLNQEYEILKELRKEERKQYIVSKETIDMINIKCHDFRHQIRQLGKEENINEERINDVNKFINIYDSVIKTSNETLNIILSEKSLTCLKYGISFSCIANGDLINFMSEEDIYSLFGNIVDNAIDAVKNLSADKRIINLKIKSVGNMVSISESNFLNHDVIPLENGLPKSNKNDPVHHGYGMKSISYIAKKYNGTLEISTENNKYTITLLFLLKSTD